jgi:hypothetical protein
MGFNKRFLSEKIISDYAKSHDYHQFKKMILSSDLFIFLDTISFELCENFMSTDSENQKTIYETQKSK